MAETLKMLSLLIAISLAISAANTAKAKRPMMAPSPSTPPPGSAGEPLPGLDCTDLMLNMSSCLSYVEEGSDLRVPEEGCCPGLSSLVDTQPACLCQLLASGETFGIKIDTSKALMMPAACKVETPPASLCSDMGIPVASPMGPSAAPTSGGPEEEPGFDASMTPGAATPEAAPPSGTRGRTARAATSMAGLISFIITIAMIF